MIYGGIVTNIGDLLESFFLRVGPHLPGGAEFMKEIALHFLTGRILVLHWGTVTITLNVNLMFQSFQLFHL